jgi:hypothetical protein
MSVLWRVHPTLLSYHLGMGSLSPPRLSNVQGLDNRGPRGAWTLVLLLTLKEMLLLCPHYIFVAADYRGCFLYSSFGSYVSTSSVQSHQSQACSIHCGNDRSFLVLGAPDT